MIYLYIKQHSVTGLKYFGKTNCLNPFKYNGSGKYWCRHIKKHGKQHVKTIELYGFDKEQLCSEFALKFSKDNNIAESDDWANLVDENGKHGQVLGFKHSKKSKLKMSISSKDKITSEETKRKLSNTLKGRILSPTTPEKCRNISLAKKGKKANPLGVAKTAEKNRGKKRTIEQRNKISDALKNKPKSEQHIANLKLSQQNRSEETRAKMSLAQIGKVISEEAKMKQSLNLKSKPIVTCIHCGKSGKELNLKPYHFDNCKLNLS